MCRQTALSKIDIIAGRGVAMRVQWRQLFDIGRVDGSVGRGFLSIEVFFYQTNPTEKHASDSL